MQLLLLSSTSLAHGFSIGQRPMPNPGLDVGLVTQAHLISEQQRQAIQQRQQGQIPGNGQMHNSPPRNMIGMSPQNFPQMPNGNMMPFPNQNGISSPGGQGQAGSPRLNQQSQMAHQLIPAAARLEAQIREKYPNATTDQVMRMVADSVTKSVNQRQGLAQNAMNAAAGVNMTGMNGMGMNGMGMNGMGPGNGRIPSGLESSPQMYAQLLRQQQENQQKAQAAANAERAAANVANVTNASNNGNGQGQSQGQAQGQAAAQGQAQGHQRSPSLNSAK